MQTKPSLLIIGNRPFANAPRVHKEILALKEHFEISELAFEPSRYNNKFYQLVNNVNPCLPRKAWRALHLLYGNYFPYLARYTVPDYNELKKRAFDLVIVHDVEMCPLGFELADKSKVVIDLHEYVPGQREESWKWKIFFQKGLTSLCRDYLPKADGLLVPSEMMQLKYKEVFGVDSVVNYNTAPYLDILPSEVDPKEIHLVHHGLLSPYRNTHMFFDLMERIDDRFVLHLYMVGSGAYYESLKERVFAADRIVWHEPVPVLEISKTMNKYDLGINLLAPSNTNHDLTISNKLFEFIQARLAVVSWPTKAIKHIVDQYEVGITTEEASLNQMAEVLNNLDVNRISYFKRKSHLAAAELTAEKSMNRISELIRTILPEVF